MTPLTPWLQWRLGWGDARTTPELLKALRGEGRLRARNLSELCGLLSARRDVARAELRLRQPRATATANPILATKAGERALKARQIWNDTVPLQELLQASESVPALRATAPAGN